jgi:hypothetical protein
MRMNIDGRLGIGTINPAHTFDLRTTASIGGATLQLASRNADYFLRLNSGDSDVRQSTIIGKAGNPLIIGTSPGTGLNEFMRMAPNGNVGITNPFPDPSARLDIVATDKGVLLPRVALTATNVEGPVTAPATGLIVYNTASSGTFPFDVSPGYYYWNGSAWSRLISNSRILKYTYPPIDINAGTTYNITGTGIPTDSGSSVFITVEGEWPSPPNIRINYIEARNGEVRFQVQNYTSSTTGTNYREMEFTITLLIP